MDHRSSRSGDSGGKLSQWCWWQLKKLDLSSSSSVGCSSINSESTIVSICMQSNSHMCGEGGITESVQMCTAQTCVKFKTEEAQ